MSLQNILQALEAEAEQQIAEIEQSAQVKIERIRAEAQTQAKAVRQKRLQAIQPPLRAEQARILNQAKLQALQRILGTREELLSAVLEKTAQLLVDLSDTGGYSPLLQALLQEAIETLAGPDQLHLRVQPQDVELMQEIVDKLGLAATVAGNLENEGIWHSDLGGVIVTTSAGDISLVNSLEARLQRVAALRRAEIADLIFDHQEQEV